MRWRKPLFWTISVVGALALLIAFVLVSAPLWIDTQGVKARVSAMIAEATDGHAHVEGIDLQFLPFPGVTVTQLRFSLPGVLDLEAQSASIDLDLPALFLARVQPGTLRVAGPQITVQIPEPAQDGQPLSIEGIEESLRNVFANVARLAPSIQVEIDNGSVLLQARGRRPLSFDNVQVHAQTEHDSVDATVSCSSSLWDHVTLQISVTGEDLAGNGTAEIVGMRAHDIGDVVGQKETWPVHDAVADANVQWQMKGLADVDAEGNLSASNASFRFGERHLDLLRPTIDASVRLHDGVAEFSIRQLVLDRPRLDASATLTHSDQGGVALEAQATNANVPDLLAAAARLAPEIDILALPPLQFEQGTITSAQVRSEAKTFIGLLEPTALHAQVELASVDAIVPEYDLQIRDFGANGSLARGQLEVHSIGGRIGKSLLRDANITVTLSDEFMEQRANLIAQRANRVLKGAEVAELINKHMTLSADATLSLDFAENLVLAKRLAGNSKVRRELDRIKQLAGRTDLHAVATMDRQQPDVRVDVSATKFTIRHAAAPFAIPFHIKRGTVRYVKDAVHANDLDGAIGRSSFQGLGARVAVNTPYELTAGKGSARLALDEVMQWATAIPEVSEHVDSIKKITGVVSVSVSKLEGPLVAPEKLRYALTASPERVAIDAPQYGPRAEFDGGAIEITNTRIRVRDVRASALDASLRIGGATNDYRNGLNVLQATVDGAAGLESLEWVRARAGLPDTMRFSNPVKFSGMDALWQRDGVFAVHGKVQVTDGPAVDVDVRGSPKHIEFRKISVEDALSKAELDGRLEGTRLSLRFKGKLAGKSVARLFVEPPIQFGEIGGDFQAKTDWKRPGKGQVEGVLHGKMIVIPASYLFVFPIPITVETFSLSGHDGKVMIKTATVSANESRVDVSGSIDGSRERYQLDVDVRGDKVVIPLPTPQSPPPSMTAPQPGSEEKMERVIDQATASGEAQLSDVESILEQIPVSGQIRINISELQIGDRELKPFIASSSLKDTGLDVELQQVRLCNILLTGGLTAEFHGHASLNVEAHVRDAPIEQSIACLTNKKFLLTGLMDIDVNLVAAGTGDEFLHSARATYTLSARDGEIRKADALEEVIVAVDETEAAKGKMPEVRKSALPYELIYVNGDIDLQRLRFEQATLDTDSAAIVAQGEVDINTGEIEATVLVAPLGRMNKIIKRIPILGRIFGGSLLAVPVSVSGTVDAPVVAPLAPTAVATRLVHILTNTLKLPADLVNATPQDGKESASSPDTGNSGQ